MKKPHYAWMICFAAVLLYFCNVGLSSNILMVYLPFIEETGITGSQGSTMFTIRSAFSLLATFGVTAFYGKFSVRTGAAISTLFGALSSLVYAFAEGSLFLYYLASAMTGVTYAIGGAIPMSVLMENWFVEKKGLAIGLAVMGSGLANIVFTPAITFMVQYRGLMFSYLVQTVFAVVCALAVFIIIRDRPEDRGTTPFGGNHEKKQKNDLQQDSAANTAAAAASKAPIEKNMQILMLVMMFLLGVAGISGSSHISIALVSTGYSASQAALMITVYSILLIAGKFLCGTATDVLGTKTGSNIFLVFAGLGCLATLLLNGTSMICGMIFACLMGLGYAVFNIGMPLWAAELSASGQHAKTLKNYQILYSAGGIAFASVPGMIADRTGEYKSSYTVFGILMLASAVILTVVYNAKEKKSR